MLFANDRAANDFKGRAMPFVNRVSPSAVVALTTPRFMLAICIGITSADEFPMDSVLRATFVMEVFVALFFWRLTNSWMAPVISAYETVVDVLDESTDPNMRATVIANYTLIQRLAMEAPAYLIARLLVALPNLVWPFWLSCNIYVVPALVRKKTLVAGCTCCYLLLTGGFCDRTHHTSTLARTVRSFPTAPHGCADVEHLQGPRRRGQGHGAQGRDEGGVAGAHGADQIGGPDGAPGNHGLCRAPRHDGPLGGPLGAQPSGAQLGAHQPGLGGGAPGLTLAPARRLHRRPRLAARRSESEALC
jgi:hypothetical protein